MPVVLQTLTVKLILKCMFHNGSSCNIFCIFIHRRPLEWSERFRNKERTTGCDLTFSIALILWNLIVASRNFICQNRNLFHIFFSFRRKSKHKVKFYLVPAPVKCLSCTTENILFRKSFINHIPHSLGTSLRCKCHTAFLNILDTFHNIQRKGINSKRRQRNIDPFSFEFVDQEVYKLL